MGTLGLARSPSDLAAIRTSAAAPRPGDHAHGGAPIEPGTRPAATDRPRHGTAATRDHRGDTQPSMINPTLRRRLFGAASSGRSKTIETARPFVQRGGRINQ